MAQDQLIDYDHLELEDPSGQGLLSTDALKLGSGVGVTGLVGLSNSTTGFADDQR